MIIEAQQGMAAVGEAAGGVQAAELARTLEPHVVLMDIRMPRMDGILATSRCTAIIDGPTGYPHHLRVRL